MIQGTTRNVIAIVTLAGGLLFAGGCGSNSYSTTEFDMTSNPTLACSDGIGAQLFAPAEAGVATAAIFREAEVAVAIAEAHEADGTYDAWYASFDRNVDETGSTVVDVPVELDDSQH
jgi:hypothetical protein